MPDRVARVTFADVLLLRAHLVAHFASFVVFVYSVRYCAYRVGRVGQRYSVSAQPLPAVVFFRASMCALMFYILRLFLLILI